MDQLVSTIATGLLLGSLYSLFAMSLVIIYRATDVLNFAMGATATMSVYVASSALGWNMPLAVAIAIGVAFAGVLGVVIERLFVRPLGPDSHFPALVVMFGISFAIVGLIGIVWGVQPRPFPDIVGGSVSFSGSRIATQRVLSGAYALVAVLLLSAFFQSRIGTEMKAAAEDASAARAIGIDTRRTARVAWFLGSSLAASSAFLLASESTVDAGLMDGVLIRAFAGIFIGGFSMVGAGVGGLLVGVLDNVFGIYVSSKFRDTLVFASIVVSIIIKPGGVFGRKAVSRV